MPIPANWITTEAHVTSCRFQFARMSTWTLGIQTHEKFRITFDYYAHGKLYSDEFQSPTAIPQNTPIALRYNPLASKQSDRTSGPSCRSPAPHPQYFPVAARPMITVTPVLRRSQPENQPVVRRQEAERRPR